MEGKDLVWTWVVELLQGTGEAWGGAARGGHGGSYSFWRVAACWVPKGEAVKVGRCWGEGKKLLKLVMTKSGPGPWEWWLGEGGGQDCQERGQPAEVGEGNPSCHSRSLTGRCP